MAKEYIVVKLKTAKRVPYRIIRTTVSIPFIIIWIPFGLIAYLGEFCENIYCVLGHLRDYLVNNICLLMKLDGVRKETYETDEETY